MIFLPSKVARSTDEINPNDQDPIGQGEGNVSVICISD